jgi:hypothetical protein
MLKSYNKSNGVSSTDHPNPQLGFYPNDPDIKIRPKMEYIGSNGPKTRHWPSPFPISNPPIIICIKTLKSYKSQESHTKIPLNFPILTLITAQFAITATVCKPF